ncbi:hypothetical protein [Arenibacter certesii]|uniref:Uncharacterized protein n=2 Tax=Arenibacter certesii TaxID=228955 RepID=A0A918MJ23_9FLAO|nr:hypothetical protein [Arenibacter certesii]GGW25914.1 hypothetical protein GCM10007383_08540 [Arenibacter certesii]
MHAVLVIFLLLIGIYVYLHEGEITSGFAVKEDLFIYLVPLLGLLAYFGGDFIYSKSLTSINKESPLKEKLHKYLQVSLIRFALLEGAAFMGIFAYMKNNTIFYLVITVFLMLYLVKLRPTKDKIIQDLRLNQKEKDWFNNTVN